MRKFPLLLFALALLRAAPAPFSILKPVISDMEDGPAVPPSFTFVPGQFIFLSYEVAGYKVSDEQKIHLSYKTDAFDPKGVRLVETDANVLDATLAEEDKNWKPKMRQQILIPPLAPSGTYKIAIQVTDDLNKTATASQELKFEVRGREVEPSGELAVRNRGGESVEVLQHFAQLDGDVRGETGSQRAARENRREILTLDVFHFDEQVAVNLAVAIHEHDAAVESAETFL